MNDHRRRALWHALALLAIVWLNVYVMRELFRREWLNQLHSIEGAYLTLARYIRGNWGDLTWFPLWYGGIPYQNTYPPLLHLVAAAAKYHAACAAFYVAGPLTLYALAARLSQSVVAALVAAVAYSIVSPSALLIREIAADLGDTVVGRRLQALTVWGEGPHVTGLTLVPLALLALQIAWERRNRRSALAAAVAMAAVALTNWLAAFSLAVAAGCLLAAQLEWRRLAYSGLLAAMAYGLAAPWIPPSTIAIVQRNARSVGSDYRGESWKLALLLMSVAAAVAALGWLLQGYRVPLAWRFALLFTPLMTAPPVVAYWYKAQLLPQPERYHLQMEMGICLLFGLGVAAIAQRLPRVVAALLLVALAAVAVPRVIELRRAAKIWLQPLDMRAHVFGRMGQWLKDTEFRDRLYAPGAKTVWLGAFADVPQFDGGFIQGQTNLAMQPAWYAINLADSQEAVLYWARAFGIHAIVASAEGSPDPYPTLKKPQKLRGLEVLWEDGTETIYRIPHRSKALARVIPSEAVVERLEGIHSIVEYVKALEDPQWPLVTWRWRNRHAASIEGKLEPGQLLSIQMSYHPGWRAKANGLSRPVRADGLGQMIVDPACQGPCTVELVYDGGAEMQIARLLPFAVLLLLGLNTPWWPSTPGRGRPAAE